MASCLICPAVSADQIIWLRDINHKLWSQTTSPPDSFTAAPLNLIHYQNFYQKKKKKKKYEGGGGVISNQTFPTKQPLKAHVAACHQIWTWVQPQWSESHSSCSRIGDSSLLRSGWARWKALVGMFIIPSSRQSADHRLDYSDSHFLGCLN